MTNKERLLKEVCEKAYDVGFGAKKHLATYDIAEKGPGWISFISIAVGIFSLVFEVLSQKSISASLLVLGIAVFYIEPYRHDKKKYVEAGSRMTALFYELKSLARNIEGEGERDLSHRESELKEIENEFYKISISKQIFMSDWYAHWKFFWQMQIGWIEDHRPFLFFRDKIPLSLYLVIALVVILCVAMKIGCW
ncbi:hypothetical protein SAMN05421848_3163 [Kushneria avicenniae]|uniref:SMODS and SLOG-associating 2TM effector domain-containing protein n=1 Tax=Kushneria avicenniae TaxID=402385 RepID=A0A1I1MVJ2_9GAMM|nr:SLATT domain-containing protein [Kushneria avicenniae]SFC88902.1 hypothetical protein SAMN05421848_3163 [Kushneria avicenniae]